MATREGIDTARDRSHQRERREVGSQGHHEDAGGDAEDPLGLQAQQEQQRTDRFDGERQPVRHGADPRVGDRPRVKRDHGGQDEGRAPRRHAHRNRVGHDDGGQHRQRVHHPRSEEAGAEHSHQPGDQMPVQHGDERGVLVEGGLMAPQDLQAVSRPVPLVASRRGQPLETPQAQESGGGQDC